MKLLMAKLLFTQNGRKLIWFIFAPFLFLFFLLLILFVDQPKPPPENTRLANNCRQPFCSTKKSCTMHF